MNALAWNALSSGLGSLVVACFWQGACLAILCALLVGVMPRLAQGIRYRIFFAGYAACIVLPCVEFSSSMHTASADILSSPGGPLVTLDARWACVCGALWIAGSLVAAGRFAAGLWSVRQLLRSSTVLDMEQAAAYASLLHIRSRGPVTLLISHAIDVPVAVGVRKPRIVIPHTLLASLDREQMMQVLRHELEHLQRRDDQVAILFRCVRCILPIHPALFWFERQMLMTREMACDDAVLRSTPRRAYAMNLTQIAASCTTRRTSVVPNLLGSRSQLSLRIEHILSGAPENPSRSRGPIFATLATLLVASAVLVQSPSLVAFQNHAEPVASSKNFAAQPPSQPIVIPAKATLRRVSVRLHHRGRRVSSASNLLAATQQYAPLPRTVEPAIPSQPAAVFVFWNQQDDGSFSTLVFEFHRGMQMPRTDLFTL